MAFYLNIAPVEQFTQDLKRITTRNPHWTESPLDGILTGRNPHQNFMYHWVSTIQSSRLTDSEQWGFRASRNGIPTRLLFMLIGSRDLTLLAERAYMGCSLFIALAVGIPSSGDSGHQGKVSPLHEILVGIPSSRDSVQWGFRVHSSYLWETLHND